jgi:hypothetical protein
VDRNERAKEIALLQQAAPGVRGILSDRTVITSLLLFGFVIIRVLVVAHGDVPVALAITSGVGVATVVVNTIVGSVQFLAMTTVLVLSFLLMIGRIDDIWKQVLAVVTIVVLILIIFFTADWFTFVVSLSVPIVAFIRRRRYSHRDPMQQDEPMPLGRDEPVPLRRDRPMLSAPPGRPTSARNRLRSAVRQGLSVLLPLALAAIFLFFFTLAVVSPVWLPAEIIKIDDQRQVIGYVLNDQGDWFSILREDPRSIIRIHKTRIKERTVCLTASQAQSANNTTLRRIRRLLGRPTRLPEPLCP